MKSNVPFNSHYTCKNTKATNLRQFTGFQDIFHQRILKTELTEVKDYNVEL